MFFITISRWIAGDRKLRKDFENSIVWANWYIFFFHLLCKYILSIIVSFRQIHAIHFVAVQLYIIFKEYGNGNSRVSDQHNSRTLLIINTFLISSVLAVAATVVAVVKLQENGLLMLLLLLQHCTYYNIIYSLQREKLTTCIIERQEEQKKRIGAVGICKRA